MNHSTTNTYTLKRDILSFSNKISYGLSRPDRKFSADMTYGLLASGSCLLTDVVDQLHEKSKKINSVDRLSKHLAKGIPARMTKNYLRIVKQMTPASPVIHIDDSDVVKPDGYRFESLGYVRDGSESTKGKNVFKKGYHVTEACVLSSSGNPIIQLIRTPGCGPGGRRFESDQPPHNIRRPAEFFSPPLRRAPPVCVI